MKQEIIRIDCGGVNCCLGKTENGFILFDTGGHMVMDKTFTNRRDILDRELQKSGCRAGNLNLVIMTHGDNDHVCNAAYIRDKYHTKTAIHPLDRRLVENPSLDDCMESFQYRSLAYKMVFKAIRRTITKVTEKVLEDYERFTPDVFIDEGFRLQNYGFEGEIIYLPGHTAGSIGILTGERHLIAGDTFANISRPGSAPNAIDFTRLDESVNKVRTYSIDMVYPGHGEPFPFMKLLKKT